MNSKLDIVSSKLNTSIEKGLAISSSSLISKLDIWISKMSLDLQNFTQLKNSKFESYIKMVDDKIDDLAQKNDNLSSLLTVAVSRACKPEPSLLEKLDTKDKECQVLK